MDDHTTTIKLPIDVELNLFSTTYFPVVIKLVSYENGRYTTSHRTITTLRFAKEPTRINLTDVHKVFAVSHGMELESTLQFV
jgi:hypothetical protein